MDVLKKYWIYVVLGIFAVNSLILDLFFFFPKSQSPQTASLENATQSDASRNYCPQSCLDKIDLTLKSQNANTSAIQSPISSASPNSTSIPASTPTPTSTPAPIKTVKEFFVPLGTGTGKSADWTVVDGIGAKIDPADYGSINQITLEVAAFVPTGNQIIWIRLYNANTLQSVAGSEVTSSGGTATLLTSSPLTLSSGNNLYQIQMKTQLQANTNIYMARLRIKTN